MASIDTNNLHDSQNLIDFLISENFGYTLWNYYVFHKTLFYIATRQSYLVLKKFYYLRMYDNNFYYTRSLHITIMCWLRAYKQLVSRFSYKYALIFT